MKKLIYLLTFMGLSGCIENNPPKFLEGKVIEVNCKPIAVIKGTSIGDQWRGYENVVVLNNPETDHLRFPGKDTTFYFTGYELTERPVCPEGINNPGVNVRIFGYSLTRPM